MRWTSMVISALLTCILAAATKPQTEVKATPNVHAINTIRIVNIAEANACRAQGKYVSLADLLSSGALKQAANVNEGLSATFKQLEAGNGSLQLKGFDLDMVVGSDGSAYKLSLIDKQQCGEAYFTDERGIIYSRRAAG